MLALSMSMVRSCAPRENTPAGCSKRLSSKAAASEDPEAYPLGYVEDLNDARTLLADFFSIMLLARVGNGNAHDDLRTVERLIERHGEGALYQRHSFLIDPRQSRTLDDFRLHQLSGVGDDGFDQDLEPSIVPERRS